MSYGNYSSWIVVKVFFKPCNCFCIKVVSRFVKKKNVRFLKKKAAQSNTAAFTSRKYVYNLICRRTAEGVHCKFKIVVQVPCVQRIKFFLNFTLTGTKLVDICIRITKCFINLIKFCKKVSNFFYAFFYCFHYSFTRCKFRFLFKVTDCKARS